MNYIINYAIHIFVSILFFVMIPLPFLIRASLQDDKDKLLKQLLNVYKHLLWFAHGGIVIMIVTGFLMKPAFSLWLIIVLLVWLALGAFLGLTAKYTRIVLEQLSTNSHVEDEIVKLRRFSLFLSVAVIAMFLTKFLPYIL